MSTVTSEPKYSFTQPTTPETVAQFEAERSAKLRKSRPRRARARAGSILETLVAYSPFQYNLAIVMTAEFSVTVLETWRDVIGLPVRWKMEATKERKELEEHQQRAISGQDREAAINVQIDKDWAEFRKAQEDSGLKVSSLAQDDAVAVIFGSSSIVGFGMAKASDENSSVELQKQIRKAKVKFGSNLGDIFGAVTFPSDGSQQAVAAYALSLVNKGLELTPEGVRATPPSGNTALAALGVYLRATGQEVPDLLQDGFTNKHLYNVVLEARNTEFNYDAGREAVAALEGLHEELVMAQREGDKNFTWGTLDKIDETRSLFA